MEDRKTESQPNNASSEVKSHFQFAGEIIITQLDAQLLSYIQTGRVKEAAAISDFLNGYCRGQYFHTMLHPKVLKNTVSDIFESEIIRDFILDLTDRVALLVQQREGVVPSLVGSISKGICVNKVKTENENMSLIPSFIQDSMHLDETSISSLLGDNFWLVVLITTTVFFNSSLLFRNTFEEIASTSTKPSK